ncbi:hypothetical protein [Clostridium botulinum]|uniref:hypothetical protein n=1 Tax=Clostridium botulinum TaxID=1491 RepID=UPI003DA60CF4
MKSQLLKIKLPKEYKEGLIKYKFGLDNFPDWLMLQVQGWTFKEHLKLEKLISIEAIKYFLNEAIEDDEVTGEEINYAKKLINKAIEEYNAM